MQGKGNHESTGQVMALEAILAATEPNADTFLRGSTPKRYTELAVLLIT